MELSEITLQYSGFHPSDHTREYLEAHMEELYTESPNGSTLQAFFSRQGHTFKGRVRIDSSRGHFFAVASGRQMKDVTHRLMSQIRKQIGKWKANRMQDHQKIYDVPFKSLEFAEIKQEQESATA